MIQLTRDTIDHAALTEQVRCPDCGGVVVFLGTVRDLTGDRVTVALDYEAYPAMAEKKLAEIEQETRARWPVREMAIVHRLGRLEVGEVSVAVAVSCPHRAEAFTTRGTKNLEGATLLQVERTAGCSLLEQGIH